MIRKVGYRFSEKIMLKQKDRAVDDDSKKSLIPALAGNPRSQSRNLTAAAQIDTEHRAEKGISIPSTHPIVRPR